MKKFLNMPFLIKLFCGFLFSSAISAVGIGLLIHGLVGRLYKNELGNLYIERLRVADTLLNTWDDETKKQALIISLNCGRLLGEYIQTGENRLPSESKNNYDIINMLMTASTLLEDVVLVNNLYLSITLIYEDYEYLISSSYAVQKDKNSETFEKYAAYIAEGKHWIAEESGEGINYVFPVISTAIQSRGIIIFRINEKELNRIINGNMEGDAAKIFILDDRGTVISDADKASLGKNLMSVPAVGSIYGSPDKRGAFTSKITGTEYFVIYWVSELNNWYYCSFVPMTELNRRMNIISLMTATLVPAFFILTALLSYPLARRLNTPVKKMEYRLEDYKLIQILLGKPDIRRAAPGSDIPAEANPEKRFVHPCFCCAALSPDCPGHAAEKNDGGYRFNGGGSIVKLCLDALSEKVFCRGLVLEDNSIALVMNFHSADMPFIKGALKKVQEQAGAFGLSLSIGIGTVVPWEKISESYNAAQRALLNRLMEGYGCLVVYREEPKTPDYYFYPTDQENIIFNNLRLHLHDKMAAAVDDFVEKIKKQKELSIDNVILIFNQLMGSVIRYIVEMHINTREIFGNETNFYYRFSELKTIDEIQLYFKELLGRITAFELRANADSKKPIKRILNYIQSNLDKTFDINALSDSIGLSYSHVRRVFSQETGENILSYVYKMKIETAKKLLAETHLSAGEIAGKLGFYNRQSFYRFFKKFEGMTPNEFRQLS